ncbi:TRL-like family protein [Leptospira gomenensis]|uniref:TRL-like family protein n=1 Tax=Leptospira gomenensis TaxID=2484974 RepID=A0A5F1YGQ8_9LEPT|nr:TRL domain-containing protein [Leptospira gomenensis]TGK31509.1 TRL-like family protein [Leptospira gomenensis]TGK46214.1 TRL-like family protein [Leptospira gomenensis]TGK54739.1 TRL-like family protein [Leptospira gomenensis]
MKKKYFLIFLVCVIALISNCSSNLYPIYFFQSNEYHISGTQIGGPTSAKVLKQGRSCATYSIITWLFFAGGEGSVEEAMKDGNITKIAVIDRSTEGALGYLYSKECVIVYGE